MDREQQVDNIKDLESKFINKVQDLIQNKYLDILFSDYKNSIRETSHCYKNSNFSLVEAKTCAVENMNKYQEKELYFERLFRFYEVDHRISI
jgi:hypothetical protein